MSIRDWPEAERPREKLLMHGAQTLSDAELLAIFLRTGTVGKTAIDMARELLQQFGGLRALLRAEQSSFCQANGLGPAKYAQLQAMLEMSQRHLAESLQRGQTLSSPQDTMQYLQARMRDYQNEVFCGLFLDTRHRVLAFEELFRGSISQAAVYPREIVKRALYHNAAAIILAHNHPSGVAEPSAADRSMTRQLQDALALVEVRVLDHLVIGEAEVVSFCEQGLL
ncbi:MAG: DNA repair protein RadC [Gammaproteobacteria bacterium]|nr:MAG: DNA repair protein RadC [Gammaproteobacteria bacterium]